MELNFIPTSEFHRAAAAVDDVEDKLQLIAKMCRLNTLYAVKKAGSGHLGSSFSAMDLVVYLYWRHLNIRSEGVTSDDRDIYFSSKGHDVPGFYSVLFSLGIISEEKFGKLRRLGGLDGHPDVGVVGVEANTGSLGMGISKARGMSVGKNMLHRKGRVYVMTGDGEFQEGQNFEALQSSVHQKVTNLTVVMDHNKLQSDRLISRIVDLGDLERKLSSFGWHVERCDGHNFSELHRVFAGLEKVKDKPKFVICDTIKGRGVSFMEHPRALEDGEGFYRWHAGAPDDESFLRASSELLAAIRRDFERLGLRSPTLTTIPFEKTASSVTAELVANAYGDALVELAPSTPDLVVLDADLSLDCKLRKFEFTFPEKFIECGIAEQDMVSMAGGLALQGLLPVVNSFACFLASRANEQIYNNSTEKTKIIYACHYAGLIPAGPGKSHQSIRDISLFGALHGCTIMQAANSQEMRQVVQYAVKTAKESCMLRMNIGPSPRVIELPSDYTLQYGCGCVLKEGGDSVLVSYGPVMLNEAYEAWDILSRDGVRVKLINAPFLNRFDATWWERELGNATRIFVLEDHSPVGGLGDALTAFLNNRGNDLAARIRIFGVEGIPACGTPQEALRAHQLDGVSLARRIRMEVGDRR